MGILIKDYQTTTEVSERSYHLKNRNIFLEGEIDEESANRFLSEMLYLAQEDSDQEVNIYINSGGGEITSGLIVVDILLHTKMRVNLYCTGVAASMAAIILACGQKGRRFILPNSKTMIHEPLLSGNLQQKATSLKSMSDNLMETKDKLNQLLASHMGKSIREINEMTSRDYWMDAEESVSNGICDAIKAPEI